VGLGVFWGVCVGLGVFGDPGVSVGTVVGGGAEVTVITEVLVGAEVPVDPATNVLVGDIIEILVGVPVLGGVGPEKGVLVQLGGKNEFDRLVLDGRMETREEVAVIEGMLVGVGVNVRVAADTGMKNAILVVVDSGRLVGVKKSVANASRVNCRSGGTAVSV